MATKTVDASNVASLGEDIFKEGTVKKTRAQELAEKLKGAIPTPPPVATERKKREKLPEPKEFVEVTTSLVGKDEILRTIALGHICGLPVLLLGEKGTAKSNAAFDYAAAIKGTHFQMQLNIGTPPTAFYSVDMASWQKGDIKYIAPICDADVVVIDETDKASPQIQNIMLSALREKRAYLGGIQMDMKWKVWIATANDVSASDMKLPFWDRMVLKKRIDRVPINELVQAWKPKERVVKIPLEFITQIDPSLVKVTAETIYDNISDRTFTFIPRIVSGIKGIWRCNDVDAMRKVCELLAPDRLSALMPKLAPPEYFDMKAMLLTVKSSTDKKFEKKTLNELRSRLSTVKPSNQSEADLYAEIQEEVDTL